MQLAPGIEVIQARFWNRPINLVLFLGKDRSALIDTGIPGTPAEHIFPYLQKLGMAAKDISLVINTHSHADHIGGNYEIWEASGKRALFGAHRLEKWLIEDPSNQGSAASWGRYIPTGLQTEKEIDASVQACGQGVKMSYTFDGGERFDLGGLELEILFCPGHSEGNLSVLERTHGVLVHGESIAGIAQYDTEGKLLTMPFYYDVEGYLRTLGVLARTEWKTLIASHLPIMDRRQGLDFIRQSLDFTLRLDAEVGRRIRESGGAVTAQQIWKGMDKLWGQYPADFGMYTLIETHVKSLLQRGLLTGYVEGPLTWRAIKDPKLESIADSVRADLNHAH